MSIKTVSAMSFIALVFGASLLGSNAVAGKLAHAAGTVNLNPKAIFQTLYTKADVAGNHKDMDGFLANYSQDYVIVDTAAQETDLQDIRFRLSTLFDNAQSVRSTTSVTSAGIHNNSATVMVKSNVAMRAKNPDNQQAFLLIDRLVSKDSWLKTDDGWMLQRSQIISEVNTANGHAIADKSLPFAVPKPIEPKDGDDSATDSN